MCLHCPDTRHLPALRSLNGEEGNTETLRIEGLERNKLAGSLFSAASSQRPEAS